MQHSRTPLHPYTITLLSAVAVADPVLERSRSRIASVGEIGSAASTERMPLPPALLPRAPGRQAAWHGDSDGGRGPGTFTWTVEDARLVFGALRSGDGQPPPLQPGLAGLRIACVDDLGLGLPAPDAPLAAAFAAAVQVLRDAGATVTPITLPVPAAECFAVTRLIGPAESAAIHESRPTRPTWCSKRPTPAASSQHPWRRR